MKTDFNINTLREEINSFEITGQNSYLESYKEFIKYFKSVNSIKVHHLYIASHFVYGWMPTILTLKVQSEKEILKLLNNARKTKVLAHEELETLKVCINNSMVGLSKLLHFINPKKYPIWDSRIFRYLTKKKSQYGIGDVQNYLDYVILIENISNEKEYKVIHKKIESKIKYKVTPARAIELVLFESDKKSKNKTNPND